MKNIWSFPKIYNPNLGLYMGNMALKMAGQSVLLHAHHKTTSILSITISVKMTCKEDKY